MKKNRSIKTALQKHPFFLLTIPFVFFIHIINYYYGLLHWSYIWWQVAYTLVLPLLIYAVLAWMWRSRYRAGVLMGFSLIIFYFFAVFYDWLRDTPTLSFIARYTVTLPFLLVVTIIIIVYLQKQKGTFLRLYYTTNLVLLFLCAGGIIQFVLLSMNETVKKYDHADPEKQLSTSYQPCDTCAKPDIYFLIFDGYTNTKTFKAEFGYDNSLIENNLRDRGFFIPANSNSNYNFTHMSISSELNLDYLHHLDNTQKFYTKDFFQSYYTISQNEWCNILRKEGYEINNYSQFKMEGAPVRTTPHLTELTWRSVLGQTFFNKLNRDIGWKLARIRRQDIVSKRWTTRIENDVKRLHEVFDGSVASIKHPPAKPQFLYAHFLVPHETFYYDSSGNRLSLLKTSAGVINKPDYVNQSVYANKFLMKPLVDSIFAFARRPFIIIIQSDHGYRQYTRDKVMLEFENFSAFYFPDGNYKALEKGISSVNTFRIIANKYFRQQMPMLKDSLINLYKRNSY